ncbi:hypothetical protein D1007_18210 [Hordeum vulgare]|nr:hypothetical protein D1007_18210 [Hordeum vulgare]
MADARRVRAERRATRIAQTTHVGAAGARRSPSPVVNATTGPEVQEQQGSSEPVTEPVDGRTAIMSLVRPLGSASRARPEVPHGWRTLAMDTELLRYRPAPDRHEDWLQRIEELIAAIGDSAALSSSLRPQPSLANNEEQDAPPPPPRHAADPEPRQEVRPRALPPEPRAGPRDEASCQMIPRPHTNACAPLMLQISRPTAHDPFWPTLAGYRWEYPGANTFMPFGLGNAVASYQRLQHAMLVPCLLGRHEEE